MTTKRILMTMVLGIALAPLSAAFAEVNAVTPSTNDANRTNGWAHVNQTEIGIGSTVLELVSTRNFASCFEYRTDGDTSQSTGTNFNPLITDGLYPFVCVTNSTDTLRIGATEYVEVRMVFGAESDERFDWTRFEVTADDASKTQCKDGAWASFGFKNQGQCIRFIQTGVDSR